MKALVYCMENWLGISHLPKKLMAAGWEVDVSGLQGSYISKTRFKNRFLPQGVIKPSPGPIGEFGHALDLSRPDLVIPGDDSTVALLHVYYELGVKNGAPQWQLDLIRRSCGDPKYYAALETKTGQMEICEKAGVRQPAWRPGGLVIDVLSFAEEYGYPVVLKTDVGTGGRGVKICGTEDEAIREARLLQGKWTVSQFIDGESASAGYVALDGEVLASFGYVRLRRNPPVVGPTTVAEIFYDDEYVDMVNKFAAATGYSGFGSMGLMLDKKGTPYFVENNCRPVPVCISSSVLGINLGVPLHKALMGEPYVDDHKPTGKYVLFPQERQRDPRMEGLDGVPEDLPTDDPELLQALWNTIDAPMPPDLVGVDLWSDPPSIPPKYDPKSARKALVFCCASYWYGIARLPKILQQGGWEVDVHAPANSYVAHTRFRDRFTPSGQGLAGAYQEFCNAIRDSRPDIVIPGDDHAVTLMHSYFKMAAKAGAPRWELDLLQRSLGDPTQYTAIESKSRQMEIAQRVRIKMPPWQRGRDLHQALEFAAEHGYPVVIKPDFGSGGVGVCICQNEHDVAKAERAMQGTWTISKFIKGPVTGTAFVAVEGRVIEGISFIKTRMNPADTGPSTVCQVIDNPQMRWMTERFAVETGYSGFGAVGTLLDESGESYFLELNYRPVPMHAASSVFGLNFGAALLAGLRGERYDAQWPHGETIVLFPQERIRDPRMEGLEGAIEDIPEDDPELLKLFWAKIKPPLQLSR